MLKLRPYKDDDAGTILSWCRHEKEFYQWTAGTLGEYPITEKEFSCVTSMMPFVAFDESGIAGFFALRESGETADELRFCYVIVDPEKRGKAYGKEMLRLGLIFAFDVYRVRRVSLGVFENNPSAYRCYRVAGFKENDSRQAKVYHLMGEDWKSLEMVKEKPCTDIRENIAADGFFSGRFGAFDEGLKAMNGEECGRLFSACAERCAQDAVKNLYRSLADECGGDPDAFFARLHEIENLRGRVIESGRVYEMVFEECGCDLHTAAKLQCERLCECSLESVRFILKALFPGRSFRVTKLGTILEGNESCRFRIEKL